MYWIILNKKTNEEIAASKEVKERIMEEVENINKSLGSYETIKKNELLPKELSIEKGELTPKLSLKRKIIIEANRSAVDRIFELNWERSEATKPKMVTFTTFRKITVNEKNN